METARESASRSKFFMMSSWKEDTTSRVQRGLANNEITRPGSLFSDPVGNSLWRAYGVERSLCSYPDPDLRVKTESSGHPLSPRSLELGLFGFAMRVRSCVRRVKRDVANDVRPLIVALAKESRGATATIDDSVQLDRRRRDEKCAPDRPGYE
jgi:hypothetical protein